MDVANSAEYGGIDHMTKYGRASWPPQTGRSFSSSSSTMRARSVSSVTCTRCAHDGEWTTFMRCSRCRAAIYCSNECQTSDWPSHKTGCTPAPPKASRVPPHKVHGVTIACNADRARGARAFEAKIIDPSHAIYTYGIVCPLFQQVGFPLLLFRHISDDPASMARDPGLDNQIAAHLLMHPSTGHPEEKWQRAGCIGTVIVVRQDGKSLSFEAIETALMYVDHLLGMFRDGVSPMGLMNPAGFQRFCQRYKEERVASGNKTFQTMTIPL